MSDLDNPKPYLLRFKYKPEYLHALVEGTEDSAEISLSFWKEIADECRRRGYKKVLVEENLEENVPETVAYEVGSKLAEILEGLIVAFVDHKAEHFDVNLLADTIFLNRGGKGKVFSNLEQAEMWLLSVEEPMEELEEESRR